MATAKLTKTKQTKQQTKTFDPANYLYGFTTGQCRTIETAVKARNLKIQTVGKTDDGTAVIGFLAGRRKTLSYEWIYDAGGYAAHHDEYEAQEKGGAIDLSVLSYADYLAFIGWKYSAGETLARQVEADAPRNSAARVENGDGVNMTLDRLFIKPSGTNPRKTFDDLEGLAESIRRHGIQQPLIVRMTGEMNAFKMQEFYKLRETENELRRKMDEARAFSVRDEATEADVKAFARALEKYAAVESAARKFAEKHAESLVAYEIIAGERRWRASEIAGLDKVPVIVREVNDTTALEIQIIENLQRRDVHPLEEADGYKNLLEKANYTIQDVSLSVGKSPDFVHQRLVLNNLIKEAQKDLADGALPIGHAMEIAKHTPEAQKLVLDEYCYNPGYYGGGNTKQSRGAVTLKKLKENIQKNILLDLDQSPFSLEDPKLRPDGLTCVECPQRTGFSPTLFGTDQAIANFCLNKSCFDLKCVNHVLNAQKAQTEFVIKDTGVADYVAPLLTGRYYGNDKFPGALTPSGYELIEDGDEICAFAESGISIDQEDAGQKFLICRNPACPAHGDEIEPADEKTGDDSSTSSKPAPDPAVELQKEREKKLIRKEEIFDVKVGEPVRLRVLKEASRKFNAEKTVFNYANAQFYQLEILIRLWRLQCSYNDRTAKDILKILELKENQLSAARWGHDFATEIKALSPDIQSRLMFLLLHAFNCEFDLTYPKWTSQSAIIYLADEFEVDYQKLDAEQRLNEAPMKHKEMFRNYLHSIEAGERDTRIPRMHSDKWDPTAKVKK